MRKRAFSKPITFGPDSDGYFSYREAKPREVPADVLQVGRAAAALCKDELGVDYALHWIYPTTWPKGANRLRRPADVYGSAHLPKRLVYVRADESVRDVASTVAHESRHHWQKKNLVMPLKGDAEGIERLENDADEWAAGFMRRHWPIDPSAVKRPRANGDAGEVAEQLAEINRLLERSSFSSTR